MRLSYKIMVTGKLIFQTKYGIMVRLYFNFTSSHFFETPASAA